MSVAQIYTAIPNDVITAARWNNEFGNIYNNGTDIAFPLTKAVSFAGFTLTLDAAGSVTLTGASGTATLTGNFTVTGNLGSTGTTSGLGFGIVNEFRLSLTMATPVTTTDVTAAGTIYLVPYRGNHITVLSSGQWKTFNNAEISLVLTATSGKPYDVFVYDNAGVLTLEILVWTNDTTRATALTYLNGVLVQSGATTRRYLGTFFATAANQTEDSVAKRMLWNYYNRVTRDMRNVVEGTNTWTYTSATWRQANANAANQLECMIGVVEDVVHISVQTLSRNSSNAIARNVGIGINSTSVNSATQYYSDGQDAGVNLPAVNLAWYDGVLPVGRVTIPWLERSIATGTATWYGDNGDIYHQAGIRGITRA